MMNKHYQKVGAFCPPFSSSDEETWTPDRRITNTLLYQLSYIGKTVKNGRYPHKLIKTSLMHGLSDLYKHWTPGPSSSPQSKC